MKHLARILVVGALSLTSFSAIARNDRSLQSLNDALHSPQVAALNRAIESCVRLVPEQYQWTYKRFRFRRPGSGPDPVY